MMDLKNKSLIIVSHDSNRGGAQNSLLNFCQILHKNNFKLYIISKNRGPIEKEYEKIGSNFKWNYFSQNKSILFFRIINKIININYFINRNIIKKIKSLQSEICICNTITNFEIVENFQNSLKIVTWVHELEYMINISKNIFSECPEKLIEITDYFLCASDSVKRHLVKRYQISPKSTYIINEIIDYTPPYHKKSNNKFIVGGCGKLSWRKGSDLFIIIADYLINTLKVKDVYFEWLGADTQTLDYIQIKHDIEKLGLKNFVRILEQSENSKTFMQNISLFVMVSREDPFPLVNIEAGAAGTPIITFKSTGGSEEFVDDDLSFNYNNVKMVSEKIIELRNNPKLYNKKSRNIYKTASLYDKKSKEKEIINLIKSL